MTAGCDVVTFSGDKLVGASQAGLVVGRKRWIERIRRDPLARALRVDKLQLAALEATLAAWSDPGRAAREVPALAMLAVDGAALERRARDLAAGLARALPAARFEVERGAGEVGGGSLPLVRLPGWVVVAEVPGRTAGELDERARTAEPPVVGYIREGKFRLAVRTLTDDEVGEAAEALGRAW